jgi:hypothetical protein
MALFKNNIRKRVLATVEQRIADGQNEYDEEARKEDERLAEGIRALTDANIRAKQDAENRIVSTIIG